MTLDEQITALLAKAEPLRLLPDGEAEEAGLPTVVNQINALRARQARGEVDAADVAPVRRGRPPKASIEGADAS
jgi:hypothetical protein